MADYSTWLVPKILHFGNVRSKVRTSDGPSSGEESTRNLKLTSKASERREETKELSVTSKEWLARRSVVVREKPKKKRPLKTKEPSENQRTKSQTRKLEERNPENYRSTKTTEQ